MGRFQPGRTEVILLSAAAMLACHLRFWSGMVERSTPPRNRVAAPTTCQFKLEDWQLGFVGTADGTVFKDASGKLKFGVPAVTPYNPPPLNKPDRSKSVPV